MLHEAVDCPALAGRIASLKHDHHPHALFLHPGLRLQKFDLQGEKVTMIDLGLELLGIGVVTRDKRRVIDFGWQVGVVNAETGYCVR